MQVGLFPEFVTEHCASHEHRISAEAGRDPWQAIMERLAETSRAQNEQFVEQARRERAISEQLDTLRAHVHHLELRAHIEDENRAQQGGGGGGRAAHASRPSSMSREGSSQSAVSSSALFLHRRSTRLSAMGTSSMRLEGHAPQRYD